MSLWKTLAKKYQANVARQLRGYGLRLEDVFNESHPEYYNVRCVPSALHSFLLAGESLLALLLARSSA